MKIIFNVDPDLVSTDFKIIVQGKNKTVEKKIENVNKLVSYCNKNSIIDIVDKLYFNGNDLKLFMDTYVSFALDLAKFCIFKTLEVTSIPEELLEKVKYTTGIENNTKWFNNLIDKLLDIRFKITGDSSPKTTLEILLLSIL